MTKALYYPTTEIHSSEILKTALLLWDSLDCIVPFKSDDYWGPEELQEAHELVVKPVLPSEIQKKNAHELILQLATSDVPEKYLIPEEDRGPLAYRIYPQKLFEDSFEALNETRFTVRDGDYWYFNEAAGLTVMSILADVCAGSKKRTVTDADVAHSNLLRSLSGIYDGDDCDPRDPLQKLVNIAVDIVDPENLTLDQLLDFRRREKGTAEGRHIKRLRQKFCKMIDEQAVQSVQLVSEGQPIEEINDQFASDMKDDLGDLNEALKRNRNDFFTSRPFILAVGAAATSLIPAIGMAANAVTVVSLASAGRKFQQGRRKALEDHAMAWLYKAAEPSPSDYLYRIGPIPALA